MLNLDSPLYLLGSRLGNSPKVNLFYRILLDCLHHFFLLRGRVRKWATPKVIALTPSQNLHTLLSTALDSKGDNIPKPSRSLSLWAKINSKLHTALKNSSDHKSCLFPLPGKPMPISPGQNPSSFKVWMQLRVP